MSWDRCAIGHPGLMALENGSTTVSVAALIFHEHFPTRSCLHELMRQPSETDSARRSAKRSEPKPFQSVFPSRERT